MQNYAERRSTGNATDASDLYGTGIRIGLYLQSLGMLFSGVNIVIQHKKGALGVKLLCASNVIAILSSWSAQCRARQMSPAEAWIVLNLVSMLFIPAGVAIYNPHAVVGEALGIFLLGVAIFWIDVAQLWFWATLYRSLPSLGTPGLAWIFVNVRITGWFRDFALVGASTGLLFGLLALGGAFWLCVKAWVEKKEDLDVSDDTHGCLSFLAGPGIFVGVVWIFAVAAAEIMIKSNGLTPQTDLSQPGQSIPFVLGLITLVDGILSICKLMK